MEVTNYQPRGQIEAVFFVRYPRDKRATRDNIVEYFNHYGVVGNVVYPEDRNHATVEMTSLNTTETFNRIRATLQRIYWEMNPETRFHVDVSNPFARRRNNHHRSD